MTSQKIQVDALVVGGGIAGMQSALDLADQGYQVAMVERDTSIGGKMIALSKVFPTLDCCSCITTPKMSAVAHHENIREGFRQLLPRPCMDSGHLRFRIGNKHLSD